jgi:hypothetical protein
MENQNLNRTETCFSCKKSAARWSLAHPELRELEQRFTAILFCPHCDRITPEDLEVDDTRTITLPTPSRPSSGVSATQLTWQSSGLTGTYHLSHNGAAAYRQAMGPDRPFCEPNTKTMCRRYNSAGIEITTDGTD